MLGGGASGLQSLPSQIFHIMQGDGVVRWVIITNRTAGYTVFGLEKIVDPDHVRKRYTRVNVYDARKEVGYQAKRTGLSMVTRRIANLGAEIIESSADMISSLLTSTVGSILEFVVGPELARNLGLFAGAIGGSVAGIAGLGIAGGISAGFSQMDYQHQKNNLRDMYAKEIGAKLHKDPKAVTVADMEALAKENPVLDEELKRCKKQRNFAVPLAVVATLASFAVAVYALPLALAAMSLPALAEMSLVGSIALKTAVSVSTYMAVKTPLQSLGNKMFSLVNETANDRIVDIQYARENGMHITPEHLMPVMLKANPELSEVIVKQFGGRYEELPTEAKVRAVRMVNEQLPLDAITQGINSGAIQPTELLFASLGQASGVPPQMPKEEATGHSAALPEHQHVGFKDKFASKSAQSASFVERISKASSDVSSSISPTFS